MTAPRIAVLVAICATGGCALIAGVRDRTLETDARGGSGGGGAEPGGMGGVGGVAAMGGFGGSGGIGGVGGVGGDGGQAGEGGAPMCDAPVACYEGPAGTLGMGICVGGEQPCVDGTLGACAGQVLPAMETCGGAEDRDCDGDDACHGDHAWSVRFGDGGVQVGRAVAVDSQGDIVVAGVFEGTVDFGAYQLSSTGGQNIFVVKLSPDGVVKWARRFGQGSNQSHEPTRVAIDGTDRVVVAGSFVGTLQVGNDTLMATNLDGYVFVLDAAGNDVWGRSASGPATERVRDVDTDPTTGDIVVAGWSGQDVTIGSTTHTNATGFFQMFVARFEDDGDRVWSNAYVNASEAYGGAVRVAPNGDVVVAGYIEGPTSFGGVMLTPAANRSLAVARYDDEGNHRFSRAYGTNGASFSNAMAMGPNGETYVLVRLGNAGAIDIGVSTISTATKGVAVIELEEDLDGVRGRLFDVDHLGGIAVDDEGFVALSLDYDAAVDFGLGVVPAPIGVDLAIVKLTPALDTTLWVRTAGAAGPDQANGLTMDALGRVYVTGRFFDTVNVGGADLVSAGSSDAFVARYDP